MHITPAREITSGRICWPVLCRDPVPLSTAEVVPHYKKNVDELEPKLRTGEVFNVRRQNGEWATSNAAIQSEHLQVKFIFQKYCVALNVWRGGLGLARRECTIIKAQCWPRNWGALRIYMSLNSTYCDHKCVGASLLPCV